MPPNEFQKQDLPPALADSSAKWGLVLGSGLGSFVETLEVRETIPYSAIDGLPSSRVPGHDGRFVLGRCGRTEVLVAQGRVHLYEGHPARDVAAGIRLMAATGVSRLVLTNAAGSVNDGFPPGHWMAITDHLNLTGASPLHGGPHFADMTSVYSPDLRARFLAATGDTDVPIFEGVYAGLPGPQYETPAEVRMLRTLGADATGMSTVLEAIQARALGLKAAGFSCLTNWGAGLGAHPLSHEEVLETGARCAGQLAEILETALASAEGS